MSKTVYQYTNDSWVDGDEECSCCSGLTFEAYNAWGGIKMEVQQACGIFM